MATRKTPPSDYAALRVLLARSVSDRQLRRHPDAPIPLTQTALAAALGTSPRSLMRYLRGERDPSEGVAFALKALAEEYRPLARLQRLIAEEDASPEGDAVPYRIPGDLPVKVWRYQRPLGVKQDSEIILVETKGLSNREIESILRSYHSYLGKQKPHRTWYVRFRLLVDVNYYVEGMNFTSRDVYDRYMRGGFDVMKIWTKELFPFIRRTPPFLTASQMLYELNLIFESYAPRVSADYFIQQVAFVPTGFKRDSDRDRTPSPQTPARQSSVSRRRSRITGRR